MKNLRKSPKLEENIGIRYYWTKSEGIGGIIKKSFEDFIVEEIMPSGKVLSVREGEDRLSEEVGEEKGLWTHFVLVKKGIDTISAIRRIAEALNVPLDFFGFAGTKDASAWTAQRVCVWKISPEKLLKVVVKNVKIRSPIKALSSIGLGDLWGNRFQVTIRDIPHDLSETKKMLEEVLEEIREREGIPNYFGHQRFGVKRPITHLVGRAIVKGDFENAVMTFLCEEISGDGNEIGGSFRKDLEDSLDFVSALKNFPRGLYYERVMLRYLSKRPRDFINALRRLPKSLLKMFIHAYQSYLFNEYLSRRIEENLSFTEPMEGDLIIKEEAQKIRHENVQVYMDKIGGHFEARVLAPLVGYKIKLSEGKSGEILQEILEREDISLTDFKIGKMPDISSKGNYREMFMVMEKPVLICKMEQLKANPPCTLLVIDFLLRSGQFATVFLRELMKTNPRAYIGGTF
ncbi:MAG: tRNA pseudouridine(13) synthase TruD [Candidatus Hodarchaeota archaeon]